MVYLTACTFIRSWWRCTFWMRSPMTLNKHKKSKIIAGLKRETMGKLIFKIEYQVLVFWYQVYQARLWESMLNRSASLAMSTSILKALPGKLHIKRHSPSILYQFVECEQWRCRTACTVWPTFFICTLQKEQLEWHSQRHAIANPQDF